MAAVQEIFGEDQPQDDGLPEEFKTMSAEDIQRRWAWEKMVFGCGSRGVVVYMHGREGVCASRGCDAGV